MRNLVSERASATARQEDGMDFTPRLRKILARAEQEARQLGHSYVGTEHVLLALLGDEGGLAGRALRTAASADAIRQRIDELMFPAPGPAFPGHPRPWGSCVVRGADGAPARLGRWMKQYFIGNRQRPLLRRSRLGFQHPPGGQRPVPALPQFTRQFAEQPGDPVLLDGGQGDLVNARRAVIRAHRHSRAPQDVLAADLVPQRVKPPPGIGLGRPVQRMLQGTDRIQDRRSLRGGTSRNGTHRAPPPHHAHRRSSGPSLTGGYAVRPTQTVLRPPPTPTRPAIHFPALTGYRTPRSGGTPRAAGPGSLPRSRRHYPHVPRPIRRGVPDGCNPGSAPLPWPSPRIREARLPLSPPEGRTLNDAAGFASSYGPRGRSPLQGLRHWAPTRPVSRPSRQPATGPPGSYPDRTSTGKRRRAYEREQPRSSTSRGHAPYYPGAGSYFETADETAKTWSTSLGLDITVISFQATATTGCDSNAKLKYDFTNATHKNFVCGTNAVPSKAWRTVVQSHT